VLKNINPILDIKVEMTTPCRCGQSIAVIVEGKAMHAAGLICPACERHCGWMAESVATALIDIVENFGRPNEAVKIRKITEQHNATNERSQMKISKMFPSKYLKADDIDGDTPITMSRLQEEEMGETKELKPVLYFKELEKGLVLNKRNAEAISKVYGDESDLWMGKPGILFVMPVPFQGRTVDSIHIRFPNKRGNAKLAPQNIIPPEQPPISLEDFD
jgi:hypothetical protein